MKSNKGITLTSLVVYILSITIIMSVVSTITIYFNNNTKTIRNSSNNTANLTRLTKYIEHDIDNAKSVVVNGNVITITTNKNETIKYTYIDKGIYRNKVKISNNVESASFSAETIYDKTKLKMIIQIGKSNTEHINKTLEYTVSN